MSYWDLIAEHQIQEAIRQGHFSRLKNEGKPLSSDDGDLAGEQWMANHILEQNDELPEWLALRKDIAQQRETARRFRDEAVERLEDLPNRLWPTDARLKRLHELYLKHVRRLNLLIDEHNHRCPSIQHELVWMREDAVQRQQDRIRRERAIQYARRSAGEHGR